METLKADQVSNSKWRVLAIPFGGPMKGGKDLDGEYFDAATDIKPRWFKSRPVIFHHGVDAVLKDAELGTQELDDEPDADGWWSTVWLDRSAAYWKQVDALLRAGKMYGSSGAVAHLVRKNRTTGHIDVWPHAEQTLTPTPANPYARIVASKSLVLADAFPDDLRADLFGGGEPAGDLPRNGDDVAKRRQAASDRASRLALATRTIVR